MDDLNGLEWSASSKNLINNKAPVAGSGNYYTSLRPTPAPAAPSSGRSTPLSAQGSGALKPPLGGIPKPSTPDSFSNLVSFGSTKQSNKLTLQEQQEKLQAEKAKKAAEQRRQYESQFGHTQFWDGLGAKPQSSSNTPPATSGSSTPAVNSITPVGSLGLNNSGRQDANDEDHDLFAAFNADTKVDNSSHYPPPSQPTNVGRSTPHRQNIDLSKPDAWNQPPGNLVLGDLGDDDDPFGLGQMGTRPGSSNTELATADDDDFLGDLGKPVEEIKRQTKPSPPVIQQQDDEDGPESDDPWDKAVAELVDMGFSAENSRRALTESGAGLNIQAAVGWLLNDAHRQAKEKAQGRSGQATRPDREAVPSFNDARREASADRSNEAVPAWMRQEGRSQSQPRRDDSRSPANSDSDISRTAAAVGSNLLKTANSLWKTSQKKVQKAVSELSQDSDASQPKWMRDGSTERQQPREKQISLEGGQRGRQEPASNASPSVTDEALMLEGDSRPPPRRTKPTADPRFLTSGSTSSRDQSPAASNPSTGRSTPIPRWQQNGPAAAIDPRPRLSKQAIEEQTAQAYVSPARRKKIVPPKAAEEPDLLFSGSGNGPAQSARHQASRSSLPDRKILAPSPKPSTPISVRPKTPPRNIPAMSPAALANSTQHRLAGTAHFKRGDYASAHSSYSSSLDALAQGHPITIVLLCNRSLTALKTGDPKAAVSDADIAINLIGPSRGENESIDLGSSNREGKKEMKEFYGKALMRKAEALEQMERWKEAGAVWREAVEAGVGGPTAIQGRQRCEKALQPKPKPSTPRPQAQRPPPKPKSAMADLAPATAQNTEAVNRLRAANLAAEKADDEKFALSDTVDARIAKWRDGRKDNLRALLGGLDQVLWEGSGWKKVGMHELVINSKVKIVYMKAIARVHPDKLPQDATTEIKMISASVFATLNEAWDKFKTENGM